jgi:integrase
MRYLLLHFFVHVKVFESAGQRPLQYRNGKPFKTNPQCVLKYAAARAGVSLPPRKVWHILRRTWASMMLQNGCDVETLRVLGNWKDFTMPLWYDEAAGADRRRAALNQIPDLND